MWGFQPPASCAPRLAFSQDQKAGVMADEGPTATEEGLEEAHSTRLRGGAGAAAGGYGAQPVAENGGGESSGEAGASEYGPLPGLEGLSMRPPAEAIQGPSGWIYHSTSLFVLQPHHFPRNLMIQIVEAKAFEPAIAATIMANIVTMAWNSPLDPPGTDKADFIAVSFHGASEHARRQSPRAIRARPAAAHPRLLARLSLNAEMREPVPRHLHVRAGCKDHRVRLPHAHKLVLARLVVHPRLYRRLACMVRCALS